MSRTLNQQMADGHEADIADWIGGSLQKSSGNQWHSQGDAKNGEYLTPLPVTGDGKATMHASVSIKRSDWAKLVEQTFGQNPVLFHRFYRPGTGPLVAEVDLATVSVEFFCELLENARKWAEHEESLKLFEQAVLADAAKPGCDCCR